jgi:hypothetical protein
MELWLIILIAAAALGAIGAGGYYGYKYYQSKQTDKQQVERVERLTMMAVEDVRREATTAAKRYTDWLYRLMLFVTNEDAETIRNIWTMVAPEGDSEYLSFSVELSEYGGEPATHYGTNTAARLEMVAKMREFTDLGVINPAWYLFDYGSDVLMEQRNGTAEIGLPLSWDEALLDQKLQVIQPPDV